MKLGLCAVALAALLVLGLRAGRIGLAGDYLDPVSRISSQDEALYAHSSIRMAQQGGWLTPMFLGRFALYKPPLAMWASGISARLFGVSRLSLRAPAVLAAALAVCTVFLWVFDARGWAAAAGAALLAISNRLWTVLGGTALTDAFLLGALSTALLVLYRDPALWRRSSAVVFGLAAGAAVLAKSAAGVLPFGVLAIYIAAAPEKRRPGWSRVALAASAAVAVAAPWFIYQAAVHPRWFWAEHVGLELLAFGTRTPPQTSAEGHIGFYLTRQWLIDPVLTLAALAAVPGWIAALRRRSPSAVLLLAWIGATALSVLAWRYRNASYLLPLVPALAILAAGYGPLFEGRRARWALAVAVLAFGVKTALPGQPWGLPFASGTITADAPALSAYCERGRDAELVIFGMDDGLYATALPLHRVRYAFIGMQAPSREYSLDFTGMGIMLTAGQFARLEEWEHRSRGPLREWGLESVEPVGAVILAATAEDARSMVEAHPAMDYLMPAEMAERLGPAVAGTHDRAAAAPGKAFLLSRQARERAQHAGRASCRL